MAHTAVEELGPVPPPIARAYGHAWAGRLAEAQEPITLPGLGASSCQVTLVGLFHRDAANLRFVADAVSASRPHAIAVEARPSFLPAYRALAAALPEPLLRKLEATPLRDMQETLEYCSLDDRLAWHAALVGANERLAAASSPSSSPSAGPSASSSSSSASSSSSSASSALSPPRLLAAFLGRELALSDKVAAVRAAGLAGLPLHGLELDAPSAYAALLAGPLTGHRHHARHHHSDQQAPHTQAQALPQQDLQHRHPHLDQQPAAGVGPHALPAPPAPGGAAGSRNGPPGRAQRPGSGSGSGSVPMWGCGPLSPEALEAEQRRIALSCLPGEVAGAFEAWFQSVPGRGDDGGDAEVLEMQLAALMAQCMDPVSYLSYVDETDALLCDAARVGQQAAAQYAQLTAVREAHFVRRLTQLAAPGGGGGGGGGSGPDGRGGSGAGQAPRRLAVVVGRAHAARLRRALRTPGGPSAAAAGR